MAWLAGFPAALFPRRSITARADQNQRGVVPRAGSGGLRRSDPVPGRIFHLRRLQLEPNAWAFSDSPSLREHLERESIRCLMRLEDRAEIGKSTVDGAA